MGKNLKIVFMGTPDFAVSSLEILVQNNYNVIGVVTAPDKPSGRGLKMNESEVKRYALSQNLNVLQPEKLKSPDFINSLNELNADVFVVVAFRMLPEIVWSMPKLGTFNLHASLLPDYRGAAPINWAIINGEKETGVTSFFLQHEIDTGDIILQEKEPITTTDTFGELYNRLKIKGAGVVHKTIQMIEQGVVQKYPQKLSETVKTAPKIFKEHCKIDWNKKSEEIYNLIRGLSPFPTAYTLLDGKIFKIYSSSFFLENHSYENGIVVLENKVLKIATNDGFIYPEIIQLEGKSKMDIQQFLNGYRFREGLAAE